MKLDRMDPGNPLSANRTGLGQGRAYISVLQEVLPSLTHDRHAERAPQVGRLVALRLFSLGGPLGLFACLWVRVVVTLRCCRCWLGAWPSAVGDPCGSRSVLFRLHGLRDGCLRQGGTPAFRDVLGQVGHARETPAAGLAFGQSAHRVLGHRKVRLSQNNPVRSLHVGP
mgnify:CR=1 FL=1